MEKVKISAVKPNNKNPRLIKDFRFKKLVKSIQDFPEMLKLRPIVVNKDMVVLGGNMRLKACAEAGLKEVYILKADELTEEQQKEFIVKDNVGFGEWDWDVLGNEWDSVQIEDWGLDVWKNHDDIVEKVNTSDEWVGMPEFETQDNPFKATISFDTEEDRLEFAKEFNIKWSAQGKGTWSTWWPYKERQDLKSIQYE